RPINGSSSTNGKACSLEKYRRRPAEEDMILLITKRGVQAASYLDWQAVKGLPECGRIPHVVVCLNLLHCLLLSGCRPQAAPAGAHPAAFPAGAPSKAAAVQFTDVTAAAGIHFKHTNGRSGRLYLPETMGAGC